MIMMMFARCGRDNEWWEAHIYLTVFAIVVVDGHDDIFHGKDEDDDNDVFEWQLD